MEEEQFNTVESEHTLTEEDEDREINLMEFELSHEQIDELLALLHELKEHKTNIEFSIDDDNDLLIHHEDEEGDGENVSEEHDAGGELHE